MTAPRPATHMRGRSRPAHRLRLLAAVAAPLALAGAVLTPAAASGHVPAPAARPASSRAAAGAGPGLRPLTLANQNAAQVTLITGGQVAVTEAPDGQYTAAAVPGSGSPLTISEQTGPGGVTTSLQAIPDAAEPLISSGQVNQGLFDVKYLAAHGDTGPAAQIPVTIAYAGHLTAAQLRAHADRLPGVTVLTALPGQGQVQITVAASRAAAFWAALTRPAAAGPSSVPAGAGLADGATRVWLTGHQTGPAASPRAQNGQPLYTVTETITRTTGPAVGDHPLLCSYPDQQGNPTVGRLCWQSILTTLWGVAGPGTGVAYNPDATGAVCVAEQPAKPLPVCSAIQISYSVPAGVYFAQGSGLFNTADNMDHTLEQAWLELDVPQLTVAGNTSFTIDANQAVPVTATTPQPGQQWTSSLVSARALPDGASVTLIYGGQSAPGANSLWAVPTPAGEQATIGQYSLSPTLALQKPQVTATVSGPGHMALHLVYAECDDFYYCGSGNPVRFSGSKSLQLADAGQGTASDFSKINAQGKLVIIRPVNCSQNPFPGQPCAQTGAGSDPGTPVQWAQLENALHAGAAGVLFDVGTDPDGYLNALPVTLNTQSTTGYHTIPDIPVAGIDNAEGNSLLSRLAKGAVTVAVHDSGPTPYAYFLSFAQEGQIAASLNYTVSSRQLAEVTNSYHSASPATPVDIGVIAERADYIMGGGGSFQITAPSVIRQYYGPLSPSDIWDLQSAGVSGLDSTWTVLDQPDSSALNWEEPPATPGAPAVGPDVYQAQPDYLVPFVALISYLHFCAGCVQANTFYPVFYNVNGGNPGAITTPIAFAPGSIHLYNAAGQQITPTVFRKFATYQLPAQPSRYKLVTPTTTWDFTSVNPATDHTPAGTFCTGTYFGATTAPCQAEPLVFLRYNAGLSLANTITPGVHQLQITGYHQDPAAPPVTSLKLWTSTDGGKTWQQARVSGGRGGNFTAIYTVPASGTNGYVSIKAEASDSAGNDITQKIDNAYAIAQAT
jgi:hypothetical protein